VAEPEYPVIWLKAGSVPALQPACWDGSTYWQACRALFATRPAISPVTASLGLDVPPVEPLPVVDVELPVVDVELPVVDVEPLPVVDVEDEPVVEVVEPPVVPSVVVDEAGFEEHDANRPNPANASTRVPALRTLDDVPRDTLWPPTLGLRPVDSPDAAA
jgi:hypothetical protein